MSPGRSRNEHRRAQRSAAPPAPPSVSHKTPLIPKLDLTKAKPHQEVEPYGKGLSDLASVDLALTHMKALHQDLSEQMKTHSDKIASFQSRMSSAEPGELSDYDIGSQSVNLLQSGSSRPCDVTCGCIQPVPVNTDMSTTAVSPIVAKRTPNGAQVFAPYRLLSTSRYLKHDVMSDVMNFRSGPQRCLYQQRQRLTIRWRHKH